MPGSVGPVRSRIVPREHHSTTSDSVTASTDSKMLASTTWPRPVRRRASSAANAPSAPNMPVSESPMLMPTRIGGRSG